MNSVSVSSIVWMHLFGPPYEKWASMKTLITRSTWLEMRSTCYAYKAMNPRLTNSNSKRKMKSINQLRPLSPIKLSSTYSTTFSAIRLL